MLRSSDEATQRQWLLLFCLMGGGSNSLLFYFIEPPGYNPVANLLAAVVFFTLMLAVSQRWAYIFLSNLALFTAVALMTYITSQTGGINSPAMVWLTALAVPALLLLGRSWAIFWWSVIFLILILQFVAVENGWLDGLVNPSLKSLVWAVMDKVLVITSLMLVVTFYDRMHQHQLKEVQQSNADLERTQLALQQAQSNKNEFIASMGHELRTPMNAILGLNSVLLSELADQPENELIGQHIRHATQELLHLVDDILDFSQLEAGQLTLLAKPLHLEQTLRHVLAGFEMRAAEKSLRLGCEVAPSLPKWVLLDVQRLEQVLEKLLDNAIKFTTAGSVQLSVRLLQDCIHFEVQDTGSGIAPEHQERVFRRFEYADMQTKQTYDGTGLGLAICERLVRLQGGRIGVRSPDQGGALFWFDLPLKSEALLEQSLAQASDAPLQPLRILVVDDNALNLMVAQLMLQKCWPDACITSASCGEVALALLDTQNFDLVLMDMVMPHMDGLEATRRLRRHFRAEVAKLPVIGLTASTLAQERARCLHAGMDEVLSKPIEERRVIELVQRLIGRTRSVVKVTQSEMQGGASDQG